MSKRIACWLVRRTDVFPHEYLCFNERGDVGVTPEPKLVVRYTGMAGAMQMASRLGSEWCEHLELFDGDSLVVPKGRTIREV